MRYYESELGWINKLVVPLIYSLLVLFVPSIIKIFFFDEYTLPPVATTVVVVSIYVFFFIRNYRSNAAVGYIELQPGNIYIVPTGNNEKYKPSNIPVNTLKLIEIVAFAQNKPPAYYYLHEEDNKPSSLYYTDIPENDMKEYCLREKIMLRNAIIHEDNVDEVKLKTNHLTIVYYDTIFGSWQVTKKVKTKDIERIEHIVKHPLSYTDSYYKVYTPQHEPREFGYFSVAHDELKEYAAKNMIHMVRVEEYETIERFRNE